MTGNPRTQIVARSRETLRERRKRLRCLAHGQSGASTVLAVRCAAVAACEGVGVTRVMGSNNASKVSLRGLHHDRARSSSNCRPRVLFELLVSHWLTPYHEQL